MNCINDTRKSLTVVRIEEVSNMTLSRYRGFLLLLLLLGYIVTTL